VSTHIDIQVGQVEVGDVSDKLRHIAGFVVEEVVGSVGALCAD